MNQYEISEIILNGDGYYVFKNLIPQETISKLLKFIRRGTSYYSENVLERRLWNLDPNSKNFEEIVNNSSIIPVVSDLLGSKYKISSLGANRLMPGAIAQEPHTDYPYWGLFDKKTLPKNINSSFVFGCQLIAPITKFTKDNGATAIVPRSQLLCEYPDEHRFNKNKIQVDLEPGDVMLYNSLLWHSASENKSLNDRIAVLVQYTSYFVKDF